METFLSGTFKFIVHKDRHLLWPRAETPTHYISMGFSPDLKEATTLAVRDMINFLVEQKRRAAMKPTCLPAWRWMSISPSLSTETWVSTPCARRVSLPSEPIA